MFEVTFIFLAVSAAIAAIVTVLKKAIDSKHKLFIRLLPVIPLVLGVLAGYFAFDYDTDLMNVAMGVLAGAVSGHSYKVFKQTIGGKDKDLG